MNQYNVFKMQSALLYPKQPQKWIEWAIAS